MYLCNETSKLLVKYSPKTSYRFDVSLNAKYSFFFNICHSAIHCKESFNFAVVGIGISVQANGISRVEVVASNLTNHE